MRHRCGLGRDAIESRDLLPPLRLCGLLLSLTLAPALARAGEPGVGTGDPQAEVAAFLDTTSVKFVFPEPMQVWAEDGAPARTARIRGVRFRSCTWSNDTELFCRFEYGTELARASTYQVELATGLRTQTGITLPARMFRLETLRPQLSAYIEGWNAGRPQIVVESDTDTTEASVASVLRLRSGEHALPTPGLTRLPKRYDRDNRPRFSLRLPEQIEPGAEIALDVVPGLVSREGPLPGTQNAHLLLAVDREPFRLREIECMGRDDVRKTQVADETTRIECIAGEGLSLSFSRALDPASRKALEAALPEGLRLLSWSTPSWYRWSTPGNTVARAPAAVATLRIEVPDREFVWNLDAALRAEDDGTALRATALRLRSTVFRPQLRAAHAANLIAEVASVARRVESVNAGATTVPVMAFGRTLRRETLTTPDSRDTIRTVSSPATAQALAEGGWARWSPRSAQPLDFAAPQFDMQAIASRRTVLAWTWAWDGSGPVANAEVELLWLRNPETPPRTVATARTGVDGVAKLTLPGDFALPDPVTKPAEAADTPMWLLRATDGAGKRAVLPFAGFEGRGISTSLLGRAETDLRTWGVADRPLYRAGDTVRYRLWQRALVGGRLRAITRPQATALVLYNLDERKVLRRWEATPDADGALIGEAPLPTHATDATYCIGTGSDDGWSPVQGACFFVGTYRAQDLWAEATTADRVLRNGDRFVVDVAGGYYSGGPASGVRIEQVSTRLTGLPLEEAYPDYAAYTFVDTIGDSDHFSLSEDERDADAEVVTDAEGRARISLPVRFDEDDTEDSESLPAFGELQAIAELKLDAREGVASNAAKARYARYRDYVGLRAEPGWFDAVAPLRLSGVVIDAEGRRRPEARIEVTVEFLPGYDNDDAPQRLRVCALAADGETPCDFPRKRSGRYRLTARSGEAAPAEIERYIRVDGEPGFAGESKKSPELELLAAPDAVDAPARLLLRHVPAASDVLLVVEAGGELLAHRTLTTVTDETLILLPIAADGRKQATVYAYARQRGLAAAVVDGLRKPSGTSESKVDVPLPKTSGPPAIEAAFDRKSAAPGQTVRLRLHNRDAQPRALVVSVNDDGLRALAADWLPYFDPHGEHWVGADFEDWQDRPFLVSFLFWNRRAWQRFRPWSDDAGPDLPDVKGPRVPASVDGVAAPVMVLDRASARAANFDSFGDVLFDISAGDGGALQNVDGGGELDSVVVTGSRLREVPFAPGPARDRGLRPRGERNSTSHAFAPRLRTRFADTALWRPDLHLAPGETREIELTLPDNLTRWRATVWSSDTDDGFEMAETVLETGLPVEVRLQTPVRLFPDDRAVLAANVRNAGDAPATLDAVLQVDAPSAQRTQALSLPAGGQTHLSLRIAPTDADLHDGAAATMTALASAQQDTGDALVEDDAVAADAVAASIELASPRIETRKVQAGWLGEDPLQLQLPALPASAADAGVQVSLLPGMDGFAQRWIDDLRDYPHRCWEQILSRGVAAAVALERGETARWPDAKAAVREALDNARVFQNENGEFRYFADSQYDRPAFSEDNRHIALTAYSVRALRFLRALGHPVPEQALEDAERFLGKIKLSPPKNTAAQSVVVAKLSGKDLDAASDVAFATAALDTPVAATVDALWQRWPELPLPARLATARALSHSGHPQTKQALAALVEHTQRRGLARAFRLDQRYDRWMSSDLREQCEFIGLLSAMPDAGDPALRRALIAGLGDLYAGGIDRVDTQTGASCLMALHDVARERSDAATALEIAHADARVALSLRDGTPAPWRAPLTAETATAPLRLMPRVAGDAPASYLAEVHYSEDAHHAQASAVGLALERNYAVLRGGDWKPTDRQTLRDGDWIRVTLTVRTTAPRHFVALTDAVPGGLRPTDLTLGGIAGLDLARVSDTGSFWFETRRLDPRAPKFYAEFLPAGEHRVHYFARIGNAGDYLAAPATAELMYGAVTRARTAATRIRIEEADVGRSGRR